MCQKKTNSTNPDNGPQWEWDAEKKDWVDKNTKITKSAYENDSDIQQPNGNESGIWKKNPNGNLNQEEDEDLAQSKVARNNRFNQFRSSCKSPDDLLNM